MDRTRLERDVLVAMDRASDRVRLAIIDQWGISIDTVLVLSTLTDEQLLDARAMLEEEGLLQADRSSGDPTSR